MTFLGTRTQMALNIPSSNEKGIYSEAQELYYDYTSLNDKELSKWLANCTIEIRGRQYRSMSEVYEMGKTLIRVKEKIGHGRYTDWLTKEFIEPGIFGLSTGENYVALATAVDKYGIDKLRYFALSAIYIAGKIRDVELDEEFQQFIFDKGEQRYIQTGKTVTKEEVLAEKKRFKAIKNTAIPEQQKQQLIQSEVPIEIVNQIKKHKNSTKQTELVEEVLGRVAGASIDTTATTVLDKKTNLKNSDYKYLEEQIKRVEKFELVYIQHSLDREGGDLSFLLNSLNNKTDVYVIATLPLDIFSINFPVNDLILRGMIYVRRPKHRLWSDINVINHLVCLSIFTKPEVVLQKSLDDYFDSMSKAVEHINYGLKQNNDKPILFTRTNADKVSFQLFTNEIAQQVADTYINQVLICI